MVSDINNVDALIICGGLGTRLKSVLNDRPKILAEINGRLFIYYLTEVIFHFPVARLLTMATRYSVLLISMPQLTNSENRPIAAIPS